MDSVWAQTLSEKVNQHLSVKIDSKAHWNFDSEAEDISASAIKLELRNQDSDLYDFLKNKKGLFYGLELRFSSVPALIRDSTEDEVLDLAYARIDQLISPQSHPQLSEQALSMLRLGARQDASDLVRGRLDQIEEETVVQRVLLHFAVSDLLDFKEDQHEALYFSFGKSDLSLGPERDEFKRSFSESLRPVNDPVQRALDSAGGGMLQVAYLLGFVKFEAFVFSERPPFESGRQYLSSVVNMDEDQFDEHRDWWNLNSFAARASLGNFKGKRANYYFFNLSAGEYHNELDIEDDGEEIHSHIMSSQLPFFEEDLIVSLDYYEGNRKNLREGFSAQGSYFLNDDLAVYGRLQLLEDHYIAEENRFVDYDQLGLGVSYAFKPFRRVDALNLRLSAEIATGDHNEDIGDGVVPIVGGQLNWSF